MRERKALCKCRHSISVFSLRLSRILKASLSLSLLPSSCSSRTVVVVVSVWGTTTTPRCCFGRYRRPSKVKRKERGLLIRNGRRAFWSDVFALSNNKTLNIHIALFFLFFLFSKSLLFFQRHFYDFIKDTTLKVVTNNNTTLSSFGQTENPIIYC